MCANTPLIEARNLSRRHADGRRWLLENVSLKIHTGRRLAVTGPSGSGKTLLLRAVAMLDPLQAGEIRWQGRPLRHDEIPQYRAAVIYLHQRPVLLEDTVESALRRPFSLAVHRRDDFDASRIAALLRQLGRDELFLSKSAGNLSGGETQIVALLRALQLHPTVLLLDEPTAAIDARTAAAVERLLDGWLAESPHRRAVVWVTHDLKQATRVADRILHMADGRLHRQEDSPRVDALDPEH